jgi:hypothetical protein
MTLETLSKSYFGNESKTKFQLKQSTLRSARIVGKEYVRSGQEFSFNPAAFSRQSTNSTLDGGGIFHSPEKFFLFFSQEFSANTFLARCWAAAGGLTGGRRPSWSLGKAEKAVIQAAVVSTQLDQLSDSIPGLHILAF